MKKYSFLLFPFSLFFLFLFSLNSCRKINESTELGYELIPPVDNVNTFDTSLSVISDNQLFNDTMGSAFGDDVAIGTITNDPEFGSTSADAYITFRPIVYGSVPFLTGNPDSITVDSVVLQLSYTGAFGDTMAPVQYNVFEVAGSSSFHDSAIYEYDGPDFAVNSQLGTKTFSYHQLNDSIPVIRKGDTSKVANVVRIVLNNSLGTKLVNLDTSKYKNDDAFKAQFRGLAIRSNPGMGNGLGYYSASDIKTKLTVYYKAKMGGIDSNSKTDFVHIYQAPSGALVKTPGIMNFRNGQANIIKRTASGNYATYLANGNPSDDRVYIQSMPGSIGKINIPGLDVLPNSVIHRAELLVYKVPSAMDNIFTPPFRLFLDKINQAGDTAYVFQKDLYNSSGAIQFEIFGGLTDKSNLYKFNITRHVQDIVAKRDKNYTLRLYAPLRTELYFPTKDTTKSGFSYQVNNQPANGRVVVAGGTYPDPSMRMRLRIIYSKL